MEATKQDYVTQIEADRELGTEDEAVLAERLALVEDAETDTEAAAAYAKHLADTRDAAKAEADEAARVAAEELAAEEEERAAAREDVVIPEPSEPVDNPEA